MRVLTVWTVWTVDVKPFDFAALRGQHQCRQGHLGLSSLRECDLRRRRKQAHSP